MGDAPETLKRPRGHLFVKGRARTGGRKPGVQNVTSRNVREMIIACANGLGGLQRLIEWCQESDINERLFWTQVWPRLLPIAIHGSGPKGEIEHSLTLVSREEVLKALAERNLPPTFFGYDKPELPEPKVIEHVPGVTNAAPVTNGADNRSAPNGAPRLSEDWMDISTRVWPDRPPVPTEQHEVVGLIVSGDNDQDPADPRISLTFSLACGRRLCVRLPIGDIEALADALYRMSAERSWQ
jgi:hypothetical protein